MEIAVNLCISGTITVDESEPLALSGSPVITAFAGVEYPGFQLVASGGAGGYVYSVFEGTLPTGLSLDPDTGIVSGTPSAAGAFEDIVFGVTDTAMNTATLEPVTITVSAMLLDAVTSAHSAWSLRQLRDAYTGAAIRVRRSSDNTEMDIDFVDGNLDTASLLSFCGVDGAGFVTTLYDQSGNGRNLMQATAASQAKIVDDGSLVMLNGKPALDSDGNDYYAVASSAALYNFLHNGDLGTVAATFSPSVVEAAVICASSGLNTTSIGYALAPTSTEGLSSVVSRGSSPYACQNASASESFPVEIQHLVVDLVDADNATPANRSEFIIDDGSAVANNTESGAPTSSNASGNFTLLRTSVNLAGLGFFPFTGLFQELVIWAGHKDVEAIRGNLNTWYEVY